MKNSLLLFYFHWKISYFARTNFGYLLEHLTEKADEVGEKDEKLKG
jgi:hypothetical protein